MRCLPLLLFSCDVGVVRSVAVPDLSHLSLSLASSFLLVLLCLVFNGGHLYNYSLITKASAIDASASAATFYSASNACPMVAPALSDAPLALRPSVVICRR